MAFQISPAVSIVETDLTSIIPSVSTATGAMCGEFAWGPVEEIVTIDNEEDLSATLGAPSNTVYKDFLCASSFLAYASELKVVRVVDEDGDSNTLAAANAAATPSAGGTGLLIKNLVHYSSLSFTSSPNLWFAKYPGVLGNSIGVAWADTTEFNSTDSNGDPAWPWADMFNSAPATNEYHIVVYDATGTITGVAGTVLEKFEYTSTTSTAKYYDGTSAYFANVINNGSSWIWVGKAALLSGGNAGITLTGGHDGLNVSDADRIRGLDLFSDAETVDVSLVFAAGAGSTASKWIIDNIAETRKDCVALVSPMQSDVVGIASTDTILSNLQSRRSSYGTTSYGIMDSNYKYMYDRYNDTYRWIPLNADIAGCIARTDSEIDPWFSPAGFKKGVIKNATKLAFNQNKTFRDDIYKIGINPVTWFLNDGAILYGDKTMQTKASAFDRINVRRLFIVLEKAISTASRYQLFEQNDVYTRTNFVNMLEPFLRNVQGRRGVTGFRVVCDSSNNTAEVIDANEFVASIWIKPTRSINYITLNFVAVRSGVSFEEIIQGTSSNSSISFIG